MVVDIKARVSQNCKLRQKQTQLVRAETDKIKAAQEAAKEAEARKVVADNKAMAKSDQQKKQRQLTLLGGIFDEDEDETPLDSTLTDRKRSKKKPLLQPLGNRPQWQAPTCTVADAVRMFRDLVIRASPDRCSEMPYLATRLANVARSCALRQLVAHSAQLR